MQQGLYTIGVKRGETGQKEREEVGKAAVGKGSRGRGKGVGFLCVSLLCFDLASVREILLVSLSTSKGTLISSHWKKQGKLEGKGEERERN